MTRRSPLVVTELVARYGDREVLSGVSLAVQPGEIHVILGGSGSGKTTLLKHLVGLLTPAAGRVELLGCELTVADEPEREAVLARIGMLFQGGALVNSLSVHENVALPLVEKTTLAKDVIDELVRMKLALVGLGDAADRTPPELSGGMKKRAALARAMALDPEVIFCDEPSAGLDPITAADLDTLLVDLKNRLGMTVVVVTHELESIRSIADSITMLARGRVLAQGPATQVMASHAPEVRAFFDRHGTAAEKAGSSVLSALVHRSTS